MSKPQTLLTLLFREFQEYRTSLCWTPLLLVVGLSTVLFIAVLMAEHISAVGEAVSQVFPSQGQGDSSVSVHVDRDADGKPVIEYRVQQSGAVPGDPAPAPPAIPAAQVDTAGSLNSLFNGLHQLFVMVFLLVCANYLLAALYTDRRCGHAGGTAIIYRGVYAGAVSVYVAGDAAAMAHGDRPLCRAY